MKVRFQLNTILWLIHVAVSHKSDEKTPIVSFKLTLNCKSVSCANSIVACFLLAQAPVRLANSGNRCSGRVEIQHNGQWGTVCDDLWDLRDASVVCRQLGCGVAFSALQSAAFGPGTGPIWLDNVNCNGDEVSITDCRHQGFGVHNCGHSEDASVVCECELPLYILSCFQTEIFRGLTLSSSTTHRTILILFLVVSQAAEHQLVCGRDKIELSFFVGALTSRGLDPLSGHLAVANCSRFRVQNDIIRYEVETREGVCGNIMRVNIR